MTKEMIKKSWTWKFSKVLFYFHFILEWARRGQRSSNSFPFSFLNLIESKALENTPSNLQNSKRQLSFMVLLFYCFPLLNWFWTILCIYHHCYSISHPKQQQKLLFLNTFCELKYPFIKIGNYLFTNRNTRRNTSILILTNLINQLIIFPIQ